MNSCSFLMHPAAPAARVLMAVLLAGFVATGSLAQQTSGSGNVVSSYSGAPNPPQITPSERPANLPSLGDMSIWKAGTTYPAGSPGYPYSNQILRPPFGPFFLPALLPVLGANRPASSESLATNYPREFAGEPFFMAYGNLAANNQLSAKRAARIDRYRVARLTLLTELRKQLSRGQDASALAAAQTPRLLELEAEAEHIRHDLTRVELFSTPADDIGKLPASSDAPDQRVLLASLRRLLSAAHFQDGFSPDQRRLLEEMALETQLVIEPEPEAIKPAPVFFWPAGVRIPAPTGLPLEAAAQFDEFQRHKAALKGELRAALDREKARLFNFDETEARAQLAAAQAPRFAELDALADQLRPALAANSLATANASELQDRQPVYAAAVLTPGLSPAQRRLLLAAAAEDSLQ